MAWTLPNNWQSRELGAICIIKTGKKDVNQGAKDGKYPFFTCSKAIHRSDEYSFDTEAILVAGNGAVGETKYFKGKFEAYQRTYVLDGFEDYAKYIYYFLRGTLSEELSKRVSGSTMPYVRKGDLSRISVPLPPFYEQRLIAAVLSLVRRAIEEQKRLIQLTTELKKSLMHKLFTEGTRGEPQKQTEIGPIPKSWNVERLENLAESFTYGTSVRCKYNIDGVPVLRIPNVVGAYMDISDLKYGTPKKCEIDKLKLRVGDLLFVRTNGVEKNAGRCSMYRKEFECDCYFASYLIRVRVRKERLLSGFLEEYTRTAIGASFLSGKASRTADGKFNINIGTLKNVLLPVPLLEEQIKIKAILKRIDQKTIEFKAKLKCMQVLFRALLHQLMTAQIRVNDLDLSELGIEVDKYQ